ncbi:MAG: WecB/TagA/CpsF family glycosyltransferase [Bacteroidota bacterium]
MPKVDILGVQVDVVDKEGLQKTLLESVRHRRKNVFAYVNVHAINLALKDGGFREFLNKAERVYCDGEGVRLAASMVGTRLPPRIVLTYWIWDLCELCEQEGLSMFFLGGRQETVGLAVKNIRTRFGGLKIAGFHHGYFEKSGQESDKVIETINQAAPDILFVGFGMPMQEHWIGQNVNRIHAHAILPSGSMIEYTAGTKSFAPAWMAENGLEWVHRLFQEPGRLWKRYVLGNPAFFILVLMQLITRGRQR